MARPRTADQQWLKDVVAAFNECRAISDNGRSNLDFLIDGLINGWAKTNPEKFLQKAQNHGLADCRLDGAIRLLGIILEACPLDGANLILDEIGAKE